VMELNF